MRDVFTCNKFLNVVPRLPISLQLVIAICKDLSMLSVTPSLASATVSRGCTLGSVTGAYLGTGDFRVASPASAMATPMTATQ